MEEFDNDDINHDLDLDFNHLDLDITDDQVDFDVPEQHSYDLDHILNYNTSTSGNHHHIEKDENGNDDDDEAEEVLSDLSDIFEEDAHLLKPLSFNNTNRQNSANKRGELTLDDVPFDRDLKYINVAGMKEYLCSPSLIHMNSYTFKY